MTIKFHISRDFSFVEFDTEFDPKTGEGLPTQTELLNIWDRLPAKDTQAIGPNGLRETQESAKRMAAQYPQQSGYRKEPLATANQRRVLERYGEWKEGMTKAEASKVLDGLGL